MQKKRYTVASLFAGVGGIDLGFQQAGYTIRWSNEIDERACKTFSLNFEHEMLCDDIRNLNPNTLEKVDILTAGFPCQAFSIAGYQRGFEDDRGSLFFEIISIARKLQPRILFLENVKNLKTHKNGTTFFTMVKMLEDIGYYVEAKVLNTCEHSDIPQNRERIYIVCFRNRMDYSMFSFPQKNPSSRSIESILEDVVDDEYYYMNFPFYDILMEEVTKKNTCYQWRRKYVRENKSNLCPTLTANMGTGGHNVPLILDDKGIRKLTPRECFRMQGFDDTYKLPEDLANCHLYKQAGNSVSVPVIQKIAENIKKVLHYNDE